MTPLLSTERLEEMLAGLENVTPGPWGEGDHWVFVPPSSGISTHALENVLASDKPQENAAHIARCDPDTIRALVSELLASRATAPVGVDSDLEQRLREPEPHVRTMDWHDYPDGTTRGPFDPIKIEAADAIAQLTRERDEVRTVTIEECAKIADFRNSRFRVSSREIASAIRAISAKQENTK